MPIERYVDRAVGYMTPHTDEPVEYQGFVIDRFPPYWLYAIKAPDGYSPPRELASSFTRLDIAKDAIDKFLECNPDKTAETAWIENNPPQRGRGRPPKAPIPRTNTTSEVSAQ